MRSPIKSLMRCRCALGNLNPNPPPVPAAANLEAYLAFLRGRTLLGRFTVAESEAAVPYFEKAIALDPNFAIR